MGQGLHTKMLQARQKNIHIKKIILVTQVAAKELGVPMSRIYIADTNTDTVIIPNRLFLTKKPNIEKVPNATATGGSTGTDLNGKAVINACQQIVQHLRPFRLI